MRVRPTPLVVVVVALAWGSAAPAAAVQSLEAFVRSALQHNTDAQEATARQRRDGGELGVQRSKLLPGLHLEGSFTENQFDAAFPLSGRTLAVQQQHQLDGQVSVRVPLIDLAQFARHRAARHTLEARGHDLANTRLMVSRQVAQAYFQLVANQALEVAAGRALKTAETSLQVTRAKADSGEATSLEVSRGRAAVAAARRQLAEAGLEVATSGRSLATLSGLQPDDGAHAPLADDALEDEGPAESFLLPPAQVPALSLARTTRLGAERLARAERLRRLPSLSGRLTERFSSATAYARGNHESYAAVLTLAWDLDLGNIGGLVKANADAHIARIQERRAALQRDDDVVNAWHTVRANVARSRAARAEAQASAEAADIAAQRYASELSTQLDMLQAQRDSFNAEAGRIKANTDLLNARIQLRLHAGMPLTDPDVAKEPAP